jgi:predicted cupin superfamily sugar epimerase
MDADQLIHTLGLQPHPEGGWYVETWRAPVEEGQRATSTGIYFLLRAGERSHWHRVDADELWLYHDGGPLRLSVAAGDRPLEHHMLGRDFAAGQAPQVVVPASQWQTAAPLGGWTLVSCVVAPGFRFDGFELAPPDWHPSQPDTET